MAEGSTPQGGEMGRGETEVGGGGGRVEMSNVQKCTNKDFLS